MHIPPFHSLLIGRVFLQALKQTYVHLCFWFWILTWARAARIYYASCFSFDRQPFEFVDSESSVGLPFCITSVSVGRRSLARSGFSGSWLQKCQNRRSRLSRKRSLGRSLQARMSQPCVSLLQSEKCKTNGAAKVAVAVQSTASSPLRSLSGFLLSGGR